MKKNLIVLRAGDKSLHKAWIASPNRDFDLMLSYYGKIDQQHRDDADHYEMRPGPKWPCIGDLLAEKPELVEQYENFWFPDDDLDSSTANINRMFALFSGLQMSLAQPALTPESYFSWPITLRNPEFLVRYTSFVEVMAPVFSQAALRRILYTFNESRSGWGLDYLWPKLLEDGSGQAVGIIDATPVTHTRPVGGNLYTNNPDLDPRQDATKVIEKFDLGAIRNVDAKFIKGGVRVVDQPFEVKLNEMVTRYKWKLRNPA